MEAGDLTDAVHRHRFFHSEDGKPYLDFVVQMLLDIAHGMEHVHSQSIIHGDLNPNNILLKFDSSNTSNLRGKVAGE
ncbi:hypothetical protein DUNSADRAFT_2305 [Dunaliella salina]|uniref:Protein kinase domain-containing protein n=1 Tax=Dunaliella salina TaxID=3046 RepID=A0ABQ7GVW3_DUNSA|nr:hypothetical protein DUNSADRAFT_2305 [Dunaliella salina]|eukprot:KAF5838761.1 hypothetical protein DUNSADRAFT_2305 [Dunaliella salina]